MNVQGRNLGGCMEYGRPVLLRRDLGPRHRNIQPTVFQRIGIVRMIPLFTPLESTFRRCSSSSICSIARIRLP
jgi:hypothetical protein